MNILMIAPEPFFESRGTPFSEYFRIQALCKLGHRVDLVTYPIGQEKRIKGLRIFRSFRPPLIRRVKTGPSWTKVLLDFFLFFKVWSRILRGRYQLIHTHEEGNIMGVFFSKLTGIPHLYDMHASLVQHMSNFQFTRSRFIISVFQWIERVSLENASSTIVICPSLFDHAATITDPKKLTVIENFMDETPSALKADKLRQVGQEIGNDTHKIVMYTGTLEAYQGIPFLIESMTHLSKVFRLVLIGGEPKQIEAVKRNVADAGLTARVLILGKKRPEEIPYYLKAADVLVSPRLLGTNIPLKIYSFLKSGVPLVATNLYTHTQSITPEIAILVEPDSRSFAYGIRRAVSAEGKEIARRAVEFARINYSPDRYVRLVGEAVKKAITP
jgi:glycosyltransferase involved in cell wall biosynthesis